MGNSNQTKNGGGAGVHTQRVGRDTPTRISFDAGSGESGPTGGQQHDDRQTADHETTSPQNTGMKSFTSPFDYSQARTSQRAGTRVPRSTDSHWWAPMHCPVIVIWANWSLAGRIVARNSKSQWKTIVCKQAIKFAALRSVSRKSPRDDHTLKLGRAIGRLDRQ